jgi:hypothetical protein
MSGLAPPVTRTFFCGSILLVALVGGGCDAVAGRAPSATSTVKVGEPMPPEQDFLFTTDAAAAGMLTEALRAPHDLAVREKLAAHYEAAGFASMAAFVRAAEALAHECNAPVVLPSVRRKGWACGPDPDSDAAGVRAIATKMQSNDLDGALAAGYAGARKTDASCRMILQYAEVVLTAAAQGKDVAPDEFETAVRLFITADRETMMRPDDNPSEWDYRLIAAAMLRRGDAAAAEIAARLALERWDEPPQQSGPMAGVVHKQLEDLRDMAHRQLCPAER